MKFIILQISDIHLKEGASSNHVLEKLDDFERVLRSLLEEYEFCFVVISGDLAFSGKSEEYLLAIDFVETLQNILRSASNILNHDIVIVPGNHDLRLTKDDKTREKLTKDLLASSRDYDQGMIQNLLQPQDNYFEFKSLFYDQQPGGIWDKFYESKSYIVGGKSVFFDLYNTSWLSQIHDEVGKLLSPPLEALEKRVDPPQCDLRISVLHHPLHWLSPAASREFVAHLEGESDIIFTGHEHVQGQYSRIPHGTSGSDYIEGGVLQESGDPISSSFNI